MLRRLSAGLAAGVALLSTLTVRGSELFSRLPADSAIAGYVDADVVRKDPKLASLLERVVPPQICGVGRDDFAAAVLGSDAKCLRLAVVFRTGGEAAWGRLWQVASPHLAPMAQSGVYTFRDVGRDLRKGRFAVYGPNVGALYLNCPDGSVPDSSGLSEDVRKLVPSGKLAAVAGRPRIKGDPFRSIRSFRAYVDRSADGRFRLAGDAGFEKPAHASLGAFALLSVCSVWLQQYLDLSPEAASEIVSKIRLRQSGANIKFEFNDFETLMRLLKEQAASAVGR